MIDINLFESFEDLQGFTRDKQRGGKDFYIIKFVVTYNPFTKTREYHLWWSADIRMRHGMHLQRVQ
jgi:hypothetical protein